MAATLDDRVARKTLKSLENHKYFLHVKFHKDLPRSSGAKAIYVCQAGDKKFWETYKLLSMA